VGHRTPLIGIRGDGPPLGPDRFSRSIGPPHSPEAQPAPRTRAKSSTRCAVGTRLLGSRKIIRQARRLATSNGVSRRSGCFHQRDIVLWIGWIALEGTNQIPVSRSSSLSICPFTVVAATSTAPSGTWPKTATYAAPSTVILPTPMTNSVDSPQLSRLPHRRSSATPPRYGRRDLETWCT